MPVSSSLVADGDRIRDVGEGARVLDLLEERFRQFGASHFLVTGLPLPDRPVEPLVLRVNWGDLRGDRLHDNSIDPRDPLLRAALRARRPFHWSEAWERDGAGGAPGLVAMLGEPHRMRLIGVPVHAFAPYQGAVFAAGPHLVVDAGPMLGLDHLCAEAFRRLFALGYLRPVRPGDLSARERRVVELSASGKTAGDIAGLLKISQRTVHAHLQNASAKLRASNKTHTVVEALRYAQISVLAE